MYKKVVVPLDGSKLAEAALPHLEEVAKGCSIPEIMLVSVTEKVKGRVSQGEAFEKFQFEHPRYVPPAQLGTAQIGVVYVSKAGGAQDIPVTMGRMAKTAADYLCKKSEELEAKGFNVSATVLVGDPPDEINRFVEEQSADLIVMASAGKSRMSHWDMSHIAEKVIKSSSAPVLLVKPPSKFKETKSRRKGVAT